jgi:serine/threonine protein kinase
MGTVWRATDELLRRQVAVKELHLPDVGLTDVESDRQRDRALREARSVARIRHPHVVVVHDVVEEDGRPWIVMELVDGRSLADVLSQDGPLEPREAARICAAVAGALRAAHDHGIQHRDVKPANVLIEHASADGGGRVVLTDFGIARVPGSVTISETGSFVGSPEYTSPERMSGHPAGPESDLWSLGALLCAAVDGQSPFHRESIGEIVHAVAIGDITPPAAAGPLLSVVRGLLDRDPARRMAAAQVQTVLMAYAETGIEPPTPELPTPEVEPEAESAEVESAVPAKAEAEAIPEPRIRGRRRRTAGAIVAVTAIAVVAGATAAVLVTRGEGSGSQATGSPTATTAGAVVGVSPSVRPSPSTKPTPTPAVTTTIPATPADAYPIGFHRFSDANGFSVALPDDSVRDSEPPRTYYWAMGRAFRFGEREQDPDPRGPAAVMQDQHVAGPSVYKGYRDGVITDTEQHGQPAALWEFTYDGFGDGQGSRRTFDLCWTENGRMYDIWLSAPVARVEQERSAFDIARTTFQAG